MPTPLITWVMLALIAGILIGARLNERWHREHDQEPDDGVQGGSYTWAETTLDWPAAPTVTVGHEWGEISTRAADAARQATRQQIERWPEGDARDRALRLWDASPGLLARAAALQHGGEAAARLKRLKSFTRSKPMVVVYSDRVAQQGAPLLMNDLAFERFVGAPREAILRGLGFADAVL